MLAASVGCVRVGWAGQITIVLCQCIWDLRAPVLGCVARPKLGAGAEQPPLSGPIRSMLQANQAGSAWLRRRPSSLHHGMGRVAAGFSKCPGPCYLSASAHWPDAYRCHIPASARLVFFFLALLIIYAPSE